MKTLLIAAVAAATAFLGFQQSLDPGANVVADRIEGAWMLDKVVTRMLDPDASTSELIALKFTSDPSVLRRLQNHPFFGEKFQNRRIFGAGQMFIDRGEAFPYILSTRDGNMTLHWFRLDGTEKTKPTGLIDSKLIMIAVGRDPDHDMMFLGGEKARDASACYGRTATN